MHTWQHINTHEHAACWYRRTVWGAAMGGSYGVRCGSSQLMLWRWWQAKTGFCGGPPLQSLWLGHCCDAWACGMAVTHGCDASAVSLRAPLVAHHDRHRWLLLRGAAHPPHCPRGTAHPYVAILACRCRCCWCTPRATTSCPLRTCACCKR